MTSLSVVPVVAALLSVSGPVPAAPGSAADVLPAPLQEVGVDERLGAQVPLDLPLVSSDGRPVRLGELLDGERPVVLTLGYYGCKSLCGLVLTGTARGLQRTGLQLGADYRAVTVGISPKETPRQAAEAHRGATASLAADAAQASGWAFAVPEGEPQVRALADAVGFRYAWDAKTQQFAHAAVLFVLTPQGRVSRYFYGVDFAPRDLRLALVEAAQGKVGTTLDKVLLTCFRFDPATRTYALYLDAYLKGGALLVFLGLAGLLGTLWRRELREGAAP
jgi:protein SCO1/2